MAKELKNSEKGDLSYFNGIITKDSIDVSNITATGLILNKSDSIAYRIDPPKNLCIYSKRIIHTITGLSKEYLYNQVGNYMAHHIQLKQRK